MCTVFKERSTNGVPLCCATRITGLPDSRIGGEVVIDEAKEASWAHPPLLVLRPRLENRDGAYFASEDADIFSAPKESHLDGRIYFEIPTNTLANRPYEISLLPPGLDENYQREAEPILQVPGEILLLERDNYRALVRDEEAEEFLPSVGLQDLPTVAEYVRDVLDERLEEDNYTRDAGAHEHLFRVRRGSSPPFHPFASAALRWTVEQLADEFRQLAMEGVSNATWDLWVSDFRFELTCEASLLEPLKEGTALTVLDEDASYLSALANASTLSGAELEIEKEIQVGSGDFVLKLAHDLRGFPVADSYTLAPAGTPFVPVLS